MPTGTMNAKIGIYYTCVPIPQRHAPYKVYISVCRQAGESSPEGR
jgi:hypothetical protein